jgi:hypothetical protein
VSSATSTIHRAALNAAACVAAEYRLTLGEEAFVGDDDYLPAELTVVSRAGRQAPKMLEELAGSGLVTYSGTLAVEVTTT